MKLRGVRGCAPRSRLGAGALARSAGVALVACVLSAEAAVAQDPPDPPRRDTIQVQEAEDTAVVAPAQELADTLSGDTIFFNLPPLEGEVPDGWERGVWSWSHDDIMASGANTVAELVGEVPGLLALFGGDYGTPVTLSAFGTGGGSVRVLRDGFETLPLAGGVADLNRVGLGGVRRVRLARSAGEIVVRLWSHEYDDGRPYSLVEAGTGDLDTNVFRGTYADPTALGGSLALALERADTRGPRGQEVGNRTGTWLRYQLHRGDGAGVALDFRRAGTETEVSDFASPASRTDWSVRGRVRLADGLVAEAFTGKSSHKVEDIRDRYAREGGARSQSGGRLAYSRGDVWLRGAYRSYGGDELPSSRLDFSGGLLRAGVAGASADVSRGSWAGTSTSATRVRAWTEPFMGISVFGSWESGTYGSRLGPLLDVVPPPDTTQAEPDTTTVEDPGALFAVTDRSATRVGVTARWRGFTVSGAALSMESDSLLPLGLELDRGQPVLPGVKRSGWEVWGRVPTPLDGLHIEGSLQRWDEGAPYLPEEIYRGAFVFHDTYLETGNLELWWTLGVRGHAPMTVHRLTTETSEETGEEVMVPETVPFYQSWYARVQVRIVSVRIFIGWENLTLRPNLQSFPGRVLPRTRAFYGLRWTMWN